MQRYLARRFRVKNIVLHSIAEVSPSEEYIMLRRLLIAALAVVLLSTLPALAQDGRTVYWEDWNVHIDNVDTSGNSYDVTEFYNLDFSGTFRFGSRVIPNTGLNAINNV